MLDGDLLYTAILEVNLFAFAYRLFHEGFSPIYENSKTNTVSKDTKQIQKYDVAKQH